MRVKGIGKKEVLSPTDGGAWGRRQGCCRQRHYFHGRWLRPFRAGWALPLPGERMALRAALPRQLSRQRPAARRAGVFESGRGSSGSCSGMFNTVRNVPEARLQALRECDRTKCGWDTSQGCRVFITCSPEARVVNEIHIHQQQSIFRISSHSHSCSLTKPWRGHVDTVFLALSSPRKHGMGKPIYGS
jgi:hypothetical protein